MRRFALTVFGLLVLVVWAGLSLLLAASAFGSYFDHSAVGYALFTGPLLTAGIHLLQLAWAASECPRKGVVADYAAGILLTAALMSFITHVGLGPYADPTYLTIGIMLACASLVVWLVAHRVMRRL